MVDTDGRVTVALDTALTPQLVREGLARELVTRIQNLRKDAKLELDDRVEVSVACDGELALALDEHWPLISGEVLAVGACPDPSGAAPGGIDFDIDGSAARISVKKV